MKRSKFSEEQVAYALRQVEAGTAVPDMCRQLGVSEATFLRLEEEVRASGRERVARLVADLTLDKHMLSEALRKNA
jgi:putative transposase